jgi:hypothetical protein
MKPYSVRCKTWNIQEKQMSGKKQYNHDFNFTGITKLILVVAHFLVDEFPKDPADKLPHEDKIVRFRCRIGQS